MNSLARKLKKVVAGRDVPSASQQNIIVDILRRSQLDGQQNLYHQVPYDRIRIIDASWVAFETVQLDTLEDKDRRSLAYAGQTLVAPNSDNFDVAICSGSDGWASFGFSPVMAKISGTLPSIGAYVGPKHGEDSLLVNYPGFRFIGASNLTGVGWVVRDRAIATGQGDIIASSGQVGTPDEFELENVHFYSGFDGWDHETDLVVLNTFGDTAAVGLKVQFMWDAGVGAYVSTNVECP